MTSSRHALQNEAAEIIRRFPGKKIVTDSRLVGRGDIFAAVSGVSVDGKAFVPNAVARGAEVVIYSGAAPEIFPEVKYIEVSDCKKIVSYLYNAFYDMPDETVKLYAVTGTNGKTTSAYLLNFILTRCGINCGLFSTVEYRDGKNVFPASHTTPDAGQFFRLLSAMRENGLTACAMESSSHALAQHRLDGAAIAGAIFTNLTGDHLDFHGNMENYFAAKVRLFTELLNSSGTAAINIDDPYGRKLAALPEITAKIATFGTSPDAAYRINAMKQLPSGNYFELCRNGTVLKINSSLTGTYNIFNLAGVLTLLWAEGVSPALLERCAALPFQVPGRLEEIKSPSGAKFFVDFAHTDDALRNVLSTAREFTSGKLWIIFGAGGDRDKSKRPRMGRAAAECADNVIVTSDNPRSEKPEDIISDILKGIPSDCCCHVEIDRAAALRYAVENAAPGDVVIVAGKGHENYQEISGVKHHFSDQEVLTELLQKWLLSHFL